MWAEVAGLEVGDELGNIVTRHGFRVTFINVLEHGILWANQAERGHVTSLDTDKLGESALDTLGNTGGDEKDLTLQVLGGLLVNILVALVGLLGEEDDSRVLVTEDWLDVVLAEGDQTGDRRFLGESDDLVLGGSTGVAQWGLVESAGEADTWGGGTELACAVTIRGVEELELLGDGRVASGIHVVVPKVTLLGTEVAESKRGFTGLSFHTGAVNLKGDWSSLFVDPLDDGVLGAAATIVHLGAMAVGMKKLD